MLVLIAEVIGGTQLTGAAQKAIELAELTHCMVRFNFNGIDCRAVAWNTVADIVSAYEHDYARIRQNGMGIGEIPDKQEE